MVQLNFNRKLRLLAMVGLVLCFGSALAQDDLQDFINKASSENAGARRAPDDITVIDLSKFSATNRTVTLDVANGRNFRFINGTLTRANTLDGPILHVGGGSYVEIGTSAIIKAEGSNSFREAVYMDGGELAVAGGTISGYYSSNTIGNSVLMTTTQDKFTVTHNDNMFSGMVSGPIDCNVSTSALDQIFVLDGKFHTGSADYGTINTNASVHVSGSHANGFHWLHVNLAAKDNVVWVENGHLSESLVITAPAKSAGDVIVNCGTFSSTTPSVLSESDLEKVTWNGNKKYQIVLDKQLNAIKLYYDDLQDFINDYYPYKPTPSGPCGCSWVEPIPMEIPCSGISMKKDVDIPEDDLYWAINGKPEVQEETNDCEGQIDEGEHDVYIRPGSKVIFKWLRWRGCGCQGKHIWVWGTLRIYRIWYYYYWRFIHIMPGGKVEIEDLNGECDETVFHLEGGEADYNSGDCKGGKYGWYCEKGEFHMNGGKLTGGTCGGWTGKNGKSCHNGGTVCGGIHNYGWHYWYDGYCTGGGSYTIYNYKGGHFYYYGGTCSDNGKIWNEGDLYIDGGGSISCGDIYCIRGGCIYILKKLTFIIRLIFTEENIVSGETVVIGGDGYKLTQDDVDKIQIVLPEGYEWKFDPSCGCISIYDPTGISSADTNQPTVKDAYNITGRKAEKGEKGLQIQRMSDGNVKKTIMK